MLSELIVTLLSLVRKKICLTLLLCLSLSKTIMLENVFNAASPEAAENGAVKFMGLEHSCRDQDHTIWETNKAINIVLSVGDQQQAHTLVFLIETIIPVYSLQCLKTFGLTYFHLKKSPAFYNAVGTVELGS